MQKKMQLDIPKSLTMAEYENKLYAECQELFDLADEVSEFIKTVLEEFNKYNLKLFDLPAHQRIFLFIITRSVKTYSSILTLCKKGYGQDAATLLRSLLENYITARYLLHDTKIADELAARFVAYKWIIFRKHIPAQQKNVRYLSREEKDEFYERRSLVQEKTEEFKKKYNITSDRALVTWSGITLRDMARKVSPELLEEYETTFRLCSRFSHPSILGDNEYMVQEDQSLTFSPLPSSIGVVPNLKSTIEHILGFVEAIVGIFDFKQTDQLRWLQKKSQAIFEMEKYQEKPSPKSEPKSKVSIRESKITFKTEL